MKKQEILTIDFGADTAIYNAHTLPKGTLACLALNIPQADAERLLELAPPLRALAQGLQEESCPSELLEPARTNAHEIIAIMANHSPFCYLDADAIHTTIDEMYSEVALDAHRVLYCPEANTPQLDLAAAAGILGLLIPFIWILEHLGYSLGQYLDTLSAFAEILDSLPNRKMDGLAEAVAQRFPEFLIFDETGSWMSGANESCQYLTMNNDKGKPTIGRRHHFVSVVGMLRADLFEGLAVGHAPKKCLNCGRWFLTLDGRHTKYCDGIDPNSEKGLSCRSAGNRKRREFREKAEDHPHKALYTTRCDSIRSRVDRGKLDQQIGDAAKYKAKNHLNKALQNADYARNQYEADMEIDALIAEAIKELANAGN